MRLPVRAELRVARIVVAALSGLLVAFAGTTHAHADPSKAELEAQIDSKWNELEPTIEQHNKVQSELDANKAKVAALQVQLAPLQQQIDAARSKVAALAVRNYKSGRPGAMNALLSTTSADALPDGLAQLEAMARKQETALKDVVALSNKYKDQKRALDELVTSLSAQESALAAQKKQIETDISNLNQMRLAAYGTTGSNEATRPAPCPVTYPGGGHGKAVSAACAQIGKPYVFGAEGDRSFDCSGLMMFAWAKAGVNLRHYTQWQWDDSKPISRGELMAGDLVFYFPDKHHVAMYIGKFNGIDYMVNAPHSGDVVREQPMEKWPISGYRRPSN